MLLIHDVVEIDAGDVFVYDAQARADIAEQELAAGKADFWPVALRNWDRSYWTFGSSLKRGGDGRIKIRQGYGPDQSGAAKPVV